MGFECSFYYIPRIGDLNAEETLKVIKYYKYLEQKKSEWYKKVYADRGIEQTFEDYCGKEEIVLPDSERYKNEEEKIQQYLITSSNGDRDIDYWCSIGRCFDEDVANILDSISFGNDTYTYRYVGNTDQIDKIISMADDYLEGHKLAPVQSAYGYKINSDGTITLIPIDGIVVNFGDVEKRVPTNDVDFFESEIYASQKYRDDDEYAVWEELKETAIELKAIDMNSFWIIFERSC